MSTGRHVNEVKTATTQRFGELWKQNFQINRDAILKNPGVNALHKKFHNLPCIVVGAGPSLDKNLRFLREAQNKAVILAGDAALKPLKEHGIDPALVVCLDPQEDITKFLAGVNHRGIVLVAPTIIHPRVLDLWEGDVLFYHKWAPDIPALVEIQNAAPRIGTLTPGGTVLSVTYDLAFQSGGNPIMFLGQDLSYTTQNTHSRASENADFRLGDTLTAQKENIVFEADIHGVPRPTLKAMLVSKQWFNWAFTEWKRPIPAHIINCSEAGILTDHCALMPLQEAIYRYCTKPLNIPWLVRKAIK
jgi:hypothetical protein